MGIRAQKHLGIYAYRVSFLNQYVTWSPAAIEEVEKLEQLRILIHGVRIHTGQSCMPIPPGVDTEQDLQRVIELLNRTDDDMREIADIASNRVAGMTTKEK